MDDGTGPTHSTQEAPSEGTRQDVTLVWPLKAGDTISLGAGHDNPGGLDIEPDTALTAIRLAPLASG